MLNTKSEDLRSVTAVPDVAPPNPMRGAGKLFYQIGEHLLRDDINDVGYFNYRNRRHHYYHGKHSPDHPSPFHHWQPALFMMAAGMFMGTLAELQEIHRAFTEPDDLDMNVVNYEDLDWNSQNL